MTQLARVGALSAAFALFFLTSCGQAADTPTDLPASEPTGQEADPPADPANYFQFDGAWVSLWTVPMLEGIELGPDNTLAYVVAGEPLFSEEFLSWDGWPIRNRDDLAVTVLNDWVVYIALTAERGAEGAGGAGNVSVWRYWITRGDGEWQYGGEVFPEGTALGDRQWAGSARYDESTGRVTFYYTAVGQVPGGADPVLPDEFPQGHPAAGRPPLTQQLALASADVVADEQGVRFENFSEHEPFLAADGEIYQTHGDSVTDQVIYGFRDPWHFVDPDTGDEFVLFTANADYREGPHNGVVGVGWLNPETGEWVNLPPIVQSAGVSSQLERPHLVFQEGLIYLFFTTHNWTFEPEDIGPEGLYGFVSSSTSFRGRYVPLNGTGLVAGNPAYQPGMTYSWLVLPGGHTMSYIKRIPASDFLAVPAPLFRISMEGMETRIVDTLTPLGPTDVAGPPEDGGGGGGTPDGGMADAGMGDDTDGGMGGDGGMSSSESTLRATPGAPERDEGFYEGELKLRDAFGIVEDHSR